MNSMAISQQHRRPQFSVQTPITPPTPTMELLLDDRPGFASKEAVESWSIASTAACALQSTHTAKMRISLASPPVSPMSHLVTTSQESDRTIQGQQVPDPPLFASAEINSSQAQVSLFVQDDRKDSLGEPLEKVDAPRRWLVPAPRPSLKPTREEYELVSHVFERMSAPMVSSVHSLYKQDPIGHLQREMEYMSRLGGRSGKTLKSRIEEKRPPRPLAPISAKVRKIRPATTLHPAQVARSPVSATKRQPTRKEPVAGPLISSISPVENRKHSRSSVPKVSDAQTKPKDVEFDTLVDYCPPLSTLSLPPYYDSASSMEIKWTQGPLEPLEDDATRLLHPAEINVARILRLSCAVYLTCKRRLCAEKLRRLQAGIAFTKTHAQSVCRIDVNKTSKIWEAMDKVGWWDTKYYKHLL